MRLRMVRIVRWIVAILRMRWKRNVWKRGKRKVWKKEKRNVWKKVEIGKISFSLEVSPFAYLLEEAGM